MSTNEPVVCRDGVALARFPLISLAVVLRSLVGFGLVGAYIILWAVAGYRSVNTTIGLIEMLGVVPVALIGLPSVVIAIGLIRRAVWAAWAAVVHDCVILPLFVGFYLPPFVNNPVNLIWSGFIFAIGIAFLIEAYFLLAFFCERRLVWIVLITVAVISFGLGILKAGLTGGYTIPRALAVMWSPKSELMVSAASSLTDAFQEIGSAYEQKHPGTTVRFNFAASGALAAQIEQGAPVDVFASASNKEMKRLQGEHLVLSDTLLPFAANSLVAIVPQRSKSSIRQPSDLKQASIERIAIGNPETTPAGQYAMQALESLHLDNCLRDKLVLGNDVRQVRAYTLRGEVDAGIVFASDCKNASIKTACRVPSSLHSKIYYPAAVVAGSDNLKEAREFTAFLGSHEAQQILRKFGFKSVEN